MGCMHQEPRVEQCPIAIQFLATYVIVMGVSNHSGNINLSTHRESMGSLVSKIIMAMKLAYGPVHHGYIKTHI